MDFFTKMKETQDNVSITENGMVGYKTTYHPLVDMNFKLTSYRNLTDHEVIEDLKNILKSQDVEYVLKYLFMARDVREGLGERRFFRVCMKYLINNISFVDKDEIISYLISNEIIEYGRYDDLFIFIGTKYEDEMAAVVLSQLKEDYSNMEHKKAISLLAKWMPSVNASSNETKKMAYWFIKKFETTPRDYRKTLSTLRAYSDVVEVKTSSKKWSEIDYSAVPSKANLKYANAFLRNDETRRRDYLAALRLNANFEGKTAKINSSVNFPHEIVHEYAAATYWRNNVGEYDEALEQMWKALKDKPGLLDTIVVRDGSGSMQTNVGNANTTALEISTGLTLYCAERLNGHFKNNFITFSAKAKLIDLSDKVSLHDKLEVCYRQDECTNTNIQNVFELILKTAIDHKIPANEMPKQILIISDMEFDGGRSYAGFNGGANVFQMMHIDYKNAGYTLPKLIFWNVCSRTSTIPCKYNENGVLLVSGFSVNVLNQVLNGETDSFVSLTKELDADRYASIPKIELIRNQPKSNKNYKPKFLD